MMANSVTDRRGDATTAGGVAAQLRVRAAPGRWCSACSRACCSRRSCSRSWPGSWSARRCSGWVEVDEAVEVVALLGLAFVLFLAGPGDRVRQAARAGAAADAARLRDLVRDRLAVSLGLRRRRPGRHAAAGRDHPLLDLARRARPVLKDSGRSRPTFGQLIIAAASIADFGAIILLSIFFSGEGGTGSTLLLLGGLFGLAAAVFLAVRGAEHSRRSARTCCASRTRPRRSACARRSCCWSASRRWPRRSGSR